MVSIEDYDNEYTLAMKQQHIKFSVEKMSKYHTDFSNLADVLWMLSVPTDEITADNFTQFISLFSDEQHALVGF